MSDRTRKSQRTGIFYGWWIVIAAALGMGISSGINFHGFGNFIRPLEKEFLWNRTTISAAFSLARLESGMLGPLEGWAVDRLGPRKLMLLGIPLMGLGYVLMSRINSLPTFFLVYIFGVTLGSSIGMSTPMNVAVANWFSRKRGLAFGIMWSGVGLGGVLVPAVGWLVDNMGWRDAATTVGVSIIVAGFPIAAVMRHRPEPYGYLPDGRAPETDGEGGGTTRSSTSAASSGFTAKRALRTSSFWFLSLSIAFRTFASSGIGLHLVPFFLGLGASPVRAAFLAGSVGVMSVPGRFGLSLVGDYVNRRYLMVGCLMLMSAAILLMSRATSVAGVVPLLVVYAVFQGGLAVIPQSLVAEYFGRRSYGTIQGFRHSVQMLGIIGGPLVSGYVFDTTDSYENAFIVFGIASVISIVLVLLARPPTDQPPSPKSSPSERART